MHNQSKPNDKEIFDANYHLERFRRNIELSPSFTGRTGKSDKEVLKSLTYIAMQNGGYTASPGERMLAENSGKDARTVSKSLWRLHDKGWITNTWRSNYLEDRASRWRINWDADFLIDVEFIDEALILTEHLLWSGYCLGENCQTIYRAMYLNNKGHKKKELEKLLGFGFKAISTALERLVAGELVLKDGRRYYVRQFESIDEQKQQIEPIKTKWNVSEQLEKKIERHQLHRIVRENVKKFSPTFKTDRHLMFFQQQYRKKLNRLLNQNATETDNSEY